MYGDYLPRTISDLHWRGALLGALVLLVCPAPLLRADDVYKSVDAEGHVVYSDQAQKGAVRIESAQTPPVIHFCWTNCFTLRFDNGLYTRADRLDETWTVERFTSKSVTLHRHDPPEAWNGFSADVVYEGEVLNDRLIKITVGGKPVTDIDAAWGSALDSLPGSNTERDQRNLAPLQTQALPPPAGIDPASDVQARATDAPPPLPNYEQPPVSQDGYLWTPGYWMWGGGSYYWVSGAWVPPPRVGVLWTPGYWAFVGGAYVFHPGYWGPHIGYYGGINYGYGYSGVGFAGGRWVGNTFAYNRTVSNVDTSVIHSTYNEAVANNVTLYKPSYNGGLGGTTAAPTAQERFVAAEPHIPPTPQQRQRVQQAAKNPALTPQANPGHPVVAMQPPAVFHTPATAGAHTAAPPAGPDHSHASPSSATHVAARQSAAPKSAAAATRTQHPSSKASGEANTNDSQPRAPEARPTH
jgi:hypothetical protein